MKESPHTTDAASAELASRAEERRHTSPGDILRRKHLSRRATDIVRKCRESAGLSRDELAQRLGVPEQIVELWEDPTYEGVDLPILRRVARAAGGELEILFRPLQDDARAAG